MNQSNRRSMPVVLTLITIFIAIFAFFVFQIYGMMKDTFAVDNPEVKNNTIGVIEIEGIILDSKSVVNRLLDAESDSKIKGIIIRINSPGGAVGPTQEIYEEIKRIDMIKPVYASFGTVAASGGYYIGAAARKIYSNAGTLTGSIGVIMQFMNLSKLYEFAKVEQKNITSGIYKDIGQPNRSMTPDEEKLLKRMIQDVHKQFVDDIMLKRKDVIVGDIWEHAQGQVFSGLEAKKIGLVDEIGSLWETGRKMHSDLKLPGKMELYYIKEQKFNSLMDFLEQMGAVSSTLKGIMNSANLSINYML